ncbi:28S ribosomal protein S24-like protein [Leptotrombidium deliense]|uniref:28S ribosomal protein S24-like protein n=1 Tax=Leptotrombidium deliense TaxID=299467 RepID=A0A443ST99_9ACAR|nr:28S ribosomal protein S24-like protein [Leptotrombidium deliense]
MYLPAKWSLSPSNTCFFHTSAALEKRQSSRFKRTIKKDNPLTYEQANPMYSIAVRKSWNSWNTSNLEGGLRKAETAFEDMFIRKFMFGTWHKMFLSEVIIKRRANLIVIGGIINRQVMQRKIYFLTGYTEEILSYLFKCPVKIELQTIADKSEMIVRYV